MCCCTCFMIRLFDFELLWLAYFNHCIPICCARICKTNVLIYYAARQQKAWVQNQRRSGWIPSLRCVNLWATTNWLQGFRSARTGRLQVAESSTSLHQFTAVMKTQAMEYLSFHTARIILCITANLAQAEPDFSSVGCTLTDMRSRLSETSIEAISLLNFFVGDYVIG